MTEKHKSKGWELLRQLEEQLKCTIDTIEVPEAWNDYPCCGICYGSQRDGCVNEASPQWVEDSIESSISNMLYDYYSVLVSAIEREFSKNVPVIYWLNIVIEPCHSDISRIVIFFSTLCELLFTNNVKAWHFCWSTPAELAEELQRDWDVMSARAEYITSLQDLYIVRYEYVDGEHEYSDDVFLRATSMGFPANSV